MNSFLGCSIVANKRDMTKTFLKAAETWTRSNITENADEAEKIRSTVKSKLREEDSINIQEISNELFKEDLTKKQDFEIFMKGNGLEEEVAVDLSLIHI